MMILPESCSKGLLSWWNEFDEVMGLSIFSCLIYGLSFFICRLICSLYENEFQLLFKLPADIRPATINYI